MFLLWWAEMCFFFFLFPAGAGMLWQEALLLALSVNNLVEGKLFSQLDASVKATELELEYT